MKAKSILELVGRTPHLQLCKLFPQAEVWMKLERQNPGGSLKDRVALAMVEAAERSGLLQKGYTIVEPTSGNTGIGLAMVCAAKGYALILTMPESMSVERRNLLAAYGAQLVLTPHAEGMSGAIAKAHLIAQTMPQSFMPSQFENPENPACHERQTAREILEDFPEGLDVLVAGVGTGGHISGLAKTLKPVWPNLHVVAVEPALSPVLSGGQAGPHPLQGIGAGFVPQMLSREWVDEVLCVEGGEAFAWLRRAAREEGLLCGISSAAVLAAASRLLSQNAAQGRILTLCYDSAERYLSVEGLLA
ncbi:MAG: cysteine synthase A [Proteobacteria bacterium]|nr:cysteine synthase A [Cystobacterineae bacterium]MCL2258221.1 cysteine synthase A [Cystobacterineae bacterium]MCL2315435.1 cysteine synthase A [Pseudomonadota bacterium]